MVVMMLLVAALFGGCSHRPDTSQAVLGCLRTHLGDISRATQQSTTRLDDLVGQLQILYGDGSLKGDKSPVVKVAERLSAIADNLRGRCAQLKQSVDKRNCLTR